jgi:hypothetical protein
MKALLFKIKPRLARHICSASRNLSSVVGCMNSEYNISISTMATK